jgi:hypothetical protein
MMMTQAVTIGRGKSFFPIQSRLDCSKTPARGEVEEMSDLARTVLLLYTAPAKDEQKERGGTRGR